MKQINESKELNELKNKLSNRNYDNAVSALTSLGGNIKIGDLEIPHLTMSIFVLLEIIESPLIDDKKEISREDLVYCLYIMIFGAKVVSPLLTIKTRENSLKRQKEIASKSPELFDVYLKHLEELNKEKDEFYENALNWWTSLNVDNWILIEQSVLQLFDDLFKKMSELNVNNSKKKMTK